ncbi:MAG TPA: APC family permease, partial [Candidatus Baltobacteraceae bacterium]
SVLASASMGPAYSLATTMGLMVAAAGGLAPLALVLLSIIMVAVAYTYSRISRVLPNAGSAYSWISAGFGTTAGAYGAWILVISNFFATMATALPAGTYTLDLLAPSLASSTAWEAGVGAIWIIASAFLLHLGMRPTARTTAFFVIAELAVLSVFAVASLVHPAGAGPTTQAGPPVGISAFVSAMVLAIWMVDGWEISASASEETREPGPTSGRGGLIGLVVTCIVLLFGMLAFMHVGTISGFTTNQADAMTYVGDQLGGGPWRTVIDITVLFSTSSALWTTMVYLTRSIYAMGRDGVLPGFLGKLDHKGAPTLALTAVGVSVTVVTILNGFWPAAATALNFVVGGSAVFLGLLFFGSTAAAVRLASTLREGPFGVAVAVFGSGSLLAILVYSLFSDDPVTRNIILALLVAGLPFAVWRRNRHSLDPEGSR